MGFTERPQYPSDERGAVLLVVVVIITGVLMMAGALLTVVNTNARSEFTSETDLQSEYVAVAAFSRAFAEIQSMDDPDLDGLGALGIEAPFVIADSEDQPVGEFITMVRTENDRQILVALAAVPSFDNPRSVRVVEGALESSLELRVRPGEGAMTISGPVGAPDFTTWGDGTFGINGGDATALVISQAGAYDTLSARIAEMIDDGTIPESALQGDLTSIYTDGTGTDHELPIMQEEIASFTASELDDFRNDMRDSVLDLADSADETITSALIGDHEWGTAENPEIIVIDSESTGPGGMFSTEGQTISGHGTLVFLHAVLPDQNLNIDWDGDVYVLGFDGDGSDLFNHGGTQGTINGSLVLLSSAGTEASIQLMDSSSTVVGAADERPSDLTVVGNLLALAAVGSHEAEVEVEGSSRLQVDGVLGLYGSRVELQATGPDSEILVNGSVAIGIAQELVDVDGGEDLEIRLEGTFTVNWDQSQVDAAMEQLAGILASFDPDLEDETVINRFTIAGIRARSKPGMVALSEVSEFLEDAELQGDYGLNLQLLH